jgi:leucyl aminopeptidase
MSGIPDIFYDPINPNEQTIYIGEEITHFDHLPLAANEFSFVKNQFENNQNLVVINRYEYQVFVVRIEPKAGAFSQLEESRRAGNSVLEPLRKHKIEATGLQYLGSNDDIFLAFIEGMVLGNYSFDKYKTKDKNTQGLKSIKVNASKQFQELINQLMNLSTAVFKARDLINEPVIHLTATRLAEEIKQMAQDAHIKVEVFEKKKIESLRMGGLLAVNKGSIDPPTFSILEWKPEQAVNEKPIVLVGKGIVYDTGGLSLKPTANSMDEMKCDMSGSAAVAGALYAIAKNKLPVHVVALIPSTDNRPGGNAYTPGDVITMHNGSTVEVLNTDAEGRLILADALSYAKHYNPELIITIATLTGSAQMAIGQNALVGMGNAQKEWIELVKTSGFETHERVVEFPFWDEYADELKSHIADMKNIGGKMAGAITAGKFLEKFTDYPFIHLDIAGPAFLKKEVAYRPKGGTGIGVRLLYQFVKNRVN